MHLSAPRRARLAVSAAFALNGALLGSWAARVPAVMEKFSLSEGAFGLLLLIMGVGALVSFPLAGRVADRRGAYPVSCALGIAYLFTLPAIGVAPGVVALGLALLAFGFAHGAMDVTMNTWAAEVEKTYPVPIMSSFHAMWSLGAGLGAAGGWLATRLDLSIGAHFLAATLLTALIFGPLMRVDWTSERSESSDAPMFALPKGPLILVGLMAMSAGLGEGAAADWSAVYLHDIIGTDAAQAALAYAVFSVTMVGMRLCVDGLIARLGPVRMAQISGGFALLGAVVLLSFDRLEIALIGYVCMGLGYAAVIPLAFSRAAADPHVAPGQAIASVATLGYGAMLLGPPTIGFVAEATSLSVSLALVGATALMIAGFGKVLRRG